MDAIYLLGGLIIGVGLFVLADRWHRHWAWRRAQRQAQRYLDRRKGKRPF